MLSLMKRSGVPPVAPAMRNSATVNPSRERRVSWVAIAFVAPLFLYLVLFYLYPLGQNLWMSLHQFDRNTFVNGGAPFVGTDVYQSVFGHPKFPTVFKQTMIFTFVSIAFQYTIGMALAVFFHRGGFRFSATLRSLFLIPWLLPIIVSGTAWQFMMDPDNGILNSLLGLLGFESVWWLNSKNALMSVIIANIWLGIPFNLVILYSGLQNISASLYDAASLEGASGWQQFRYITFPLLRPVSLITLMLGLVYTLKVVDIIWIMSFGTGSSRTLATWAYELAFGKGASAVIRYSEASAISTVLLVIALFFAVFYLIRQQQGEK